MLLRRKKISNLLATLLMFSASLPAWADRGRDKLDLREVNFFSLRTPADYVARYASHPPSTERLARSKRIAITHRPPFHPLFANQVFGDIIVIEGSGGIAYTDPCPEPYQSQTCTYFNDNAITDVASEALRYTQDQHDSIIIFTTFSQTGQSYAAYYLPLQNDVMGLGACNQAAGETHGCQFDSTRGLRLQGLQYMSSVKSWADQEASFNGRASPIDDPAHWVYGGLGHEALHRWGSALRFVHPANGQISKAMLGEALSHWNPSVNAKGSLHYGITWSDNGDGSFELLNQSQGYWDLDLYAMGVLPAAEVQPWFLIENARSSELATIMNAMGYRFSGGLSGPGLYVPIPPIDYLDDVIRGYYPGFGEHITATGQRLDLSVDDVLAAEGAREPAFGAAPDHFRQAWVLVTAPDQRASQVGRYVSELETVRRTFEQWFAEHTGGRMRVCTQLAGDCPEPRLAPRGARSDDSQSNGNGVVDPGESIDLYAAVRNEGDASSHGVQVTMTAIDEGLSVDRASLSLGDLGAGETRESDKSLLAYVAPEASCGSVLRYRLRFSGTDTAPRDQAGSLYIGLKRVDGADFEDGDDGFTFDPGGEDDASAGAFARGSSSRRYAGGTRITPAGQASGGQALLTDPSDGETGNHDVDGGFTSVLSPAYKIEGLRDPFVGYRYWHVAVAGDGSPRAGNDNRLLVEISGDDGKSFKEVVRHIDSLPEWSTALIRLKDHFDPLPATIRLRFSQFDDGEDDIVEAGLDDIQLLDLAGDCEPEGCGCRASARAPESVKITLLALGLFGLRRRRQKKALKRP